MISRFALLACFAASCLPFLSSRSAFADLIIPVAYDMPNGGTGAYDYHDDKYTGSGNHFADYEALSGGTGDLTDGIFTTDHWDAAEAPAGAGPYVGWINVVPTITVHLPSAVPITLVSVHVDDSNGLGGVYLPTSIDITLNGDTYSATPIQRPDYATQWIDILIPSTEAPTGTLTITLNHPVQTTWVFADEFQVNTVPEPVAAFAACPALLLLRRRA